MPKKRYWYRANGEANSYTVLDGINWLFVIQVNGELHVDQQEAYMKTICEELNNANSVLLRQ